jgi:carbon storage regulator
VLVLSRKAGESLVFPSLDIEVTVVEILGERVRIGVRADPGVRVLRDELIDRLDEEQTDACS